VNATLQRVQSLRRVTHEKQGVGQTTLARGPRRTSRRFHQTGSAGIDADCQSFRIRSRKPDYCPAVARAKVEDRPRVAVDQLVELADVELAQLTASNHAHGTWIITHQR
jgi:hypothetical protein